MRKIARQPRGMALVVVLSVVGIASIMAYALLSGASLQSDLLNNAQLGAQATTLARGGFDLAVYYLENPLVAPAGQMSNGYWAGATNISLGSSMAGTADVTVSRVSASPESYSITVTGKASSGAVVSHPVSGQITITRTFSPMRAVSLLGDITVDGGILVNGDLQTNGQITMATGGRITGTGTAHAISWAGGTMGRNVLLSSSQSVWVPAAGTIRDYYTYTDNGVSYVAVQLLAGLDQQTLGPTVNNPAGIYWSASDLQISKNVTINGTLLLKTGKLTIIGSGNVITPKAGYPALVVKDDLSIKGKNHSLTVNGLAWISDDIQGEPGNNNGSSVTINGALMLGNAVAVVNSSYQGTLTVTYDATKANVPDFSTDLQFQIVKTKVNSWQP